MNDRTRTSTALDVAHRRRALCLSAAAVPLLAACGDTALLAPSATEGPTPVIGPPRTALVPTVHVATATGWPAGRVPAVAPGLRVSPFATGLDHPRWITVLPSGDVLVAETNAPARPDDGKGVKAWITKLMMKRAGAGTASPDRITLLRDADGDGMAETRTIFVDRLRSPFGMALAGAWLYVANTDGIVRFPYRDGETRLAGDGETVVDLPAGPINHHWTKNIIATADGRTLYATVGSNSNVGENGLDKEEGRAAIWKVDVEQRSKRLFATGLRNPNGLALDPASGVLWTVVNERDELGSDLVPDYLTSVTEDAFYGWPYSYYGAHVDDRVPSRPDLVARAQVPDYALGAHVAALGLTSSAGSRLPAAYASGMIIGEHGSWNRRPRSGYKVVYVPFANGRPSGPPIDLVTGFLSPDGEAWGRPVGVAIDRRGNLLIADDVGNTIWRVSAA